MKMPWGKHNIYGSYMKGIWYPNSEIYNIPGAFQVSCPSRRFPNGYLNHFYTYKFWKLFENYYPEEAEKIVAESMKKLLTGKNKRR